MANFRFINEQGQDDTGRVATYRQRVIDLNQAAITLNPIDYITTFLMGGVQTTESLTLNIAENNKSKIGDTLELIFAPNFAGLTVTFNAGFLNAAEQTINAGERLILTFIYDGQSFVCMSGGSGAGGGGGAIVTYAVNIIKPTGQPLATFEVYNNTGFTIAPPYETSTGNYQIDFPQFSVAEYQMEMTASERILNSTELLTHYFTNRAIIGASNNNTFIGVIQTVDVTTHAFSDQTQSTIVCKFFKK